MYHATAQVSTSPLNYTKDVLITDHILWMARELFPRCSLVYLVSPAIPHLTGSHPLIL